MQIMMMIYQPEDVFDARTDSTEDEFWRAWRAYHQALIDAGVYVAGDRLDRPSTATTVRMRDGKRQVQDGPFADSKEQLGGFIILEVPSIDHALDWAARCPTAIRWGSPVEVRPIYQAAVPM